MSLYMSYIYSYGNTHISSFYDAVPFPFSRYKLVREIVKKNVSTTWMKWFLEVLNLLGSFITYQIFQSKKRKKNQFQSWLYFAHVAFLWDTSNLFLRLSKCLSSCEKAFIKNIIPSIDVKIYRFFVHCILTYQS